MISANNISIPGALSELTLGQCIAFMREYGAAIDNELQAYYADKTIKEKRLQVLTAKCNVSRAYAVVSFFSGVDIVATQSTYNVPDAMQLYSNSAIAMLYLSNSAENEYPRQYQYAGSTWSIQEPILGNSSTLTFGQFIDSKVLAQALTASGQSKWELLQYLCAIYLQKDGESYNEAFVHDGSERMALMNDLPMNVALHVLNYFESLNAFIAENFSVFAPGDGSMGNANMAKHMEQWGWVNFLKTIAKSKVYDIAGSGMNSIDCARAAKLIDVLIDASEERDYNIAANRDMEAAYSRIK